jgi:hypothetical protein
MTDRDVLIAKTQELDTLCAKEVEGKARERYLPGTHQTYLVPISSSASEIETWK